MTDKKNQSNYPASVVKVVDDYTVVINRGSEQGIKKGDNFLIYYIDPIELIDPETGDSLGQLEVIRGTGSATHVQPKITTVKSNRYISGSRIIRRQSGLLASLASEIVEEPEKELSPFDEPRIGDKVKPV